MAGDWIKMNKSLPRDPRVVRISSALKADRLRTVGGLLSAWCLADELTEDGNLDAYTPELLDELVGLPGLARAMESVGWLVIGDGFLEFPRFDEHNGKSAKRRAQDAIRKSSAREADKCPHDKRTKSGPEKRREESSNKEGAELVTVESAISYGAQIGVDEGTVRHWHDTRSRDGWTIAGNNGIARPIRSWQHDLATAKSWAKPSQGKAIAPQRTKRELTSADVGL